MSLSSAPTSKRNKKTFVFAYGLLAFLIGLFISTFDIIVHVQFFSLLGHIPLAISFVISGIAGTILSYIISSLVRKVSASAMSLIIIMLTIFLAGSYFLLLWYYPSINTAIYGMVVFFPVNMILILGMWRFGRMLVTPRSSRKIFPVVKLSLIWGIILGSLGFSASLFVFDYKLATFIAPLTLALLLPILLIANYSLKKSGFRDYGKTKFVPVKNKVFLFLSSKFTSYLLIFVVISATIGYLLHFAFLNAAWAGFFTKVGLAKFYGMFMAVSSIFTFGINKYVIKRVLYSYDSPYSILIQPILLFLVLAVTIIGSFVLKNIQPHEHFTLFFLLIILVKVVFISSYQAIQAPSLRTLFHTLDIRFRQIAYSRIEGGAIMLGLVLCGGVVFGLTYFNFYSLTIILGVATILSLVLLWIVIKLIQEYRAAQEKVLSKMRFRRASSSNEVGFLERASRVISTNNEWKIIESLHLLELHHPIEYESYLKELISHPSELVRTHVLSSIKDKRINDTLPALKEALIDAPKNEQLEINEVIDSFPSAKSIKLAEEVVRQCVYNGSVSERANLPLIISESKLKEKDNLLATLTKDFEPAVRKSAVRALARQKTEKFSYALLDFIHPGKFDPYVMDAIAGSGDSALDYLEREAMVPGADDLVQARILRLYGKIGSEKSIGILLDKLGNLNDYLLLHSVQALVERRFQANRTNKYRIHGLLVKLVSEITYNLNILKYLKNKKKLKLLYNAYESEVDLNYNQLFRFLSLIYNPNVIESLKKLFLLGSRTQVNHAIELADQYLDDDIKPLIFPLLEDLPASERLRRLEFYFQQPKMSPEEIIRSTLTHDYNKLSLYPRTCAMLVILEQKLQGFDLELIFNASHPEYLLGETALFVLKNVYPEKFNEIKNSFTKDIELIIQSPAIVEANPELLLFTHYSELLDYKAFKNLSEFVALKLSKIARKIELEENESISINNLKDKYQLISINKNFSPFQQKSVLSLAERLIPISLLLDEGVENIVATEKLNIWLFEKSVVTELVYDNVDLANTILRGIENFKVIKDE